MTMNCCYIKTVTDVFSCLCWVVIILTILYFILKYVVQPYMKTYHEIKLKKETFNLEKEWATFKEGKASSDESLHKKIADLSKENEELKKELVAEQSRQALLKEHLEEYKQHLKMIMSNTKNQ